MTEFHKLSELIISEMSLFPKGNKEIIENSKNWTLEIDAYWNTKRIDLCIKSRKPNLFKEFAHCKIKNAYLISLIARYDNYSFSGKTSDISDFLLTSPLSLNLLKSSKANFELNGKYLIYKCRINSQDKNSLSNIFKLIDLLTVEIDKIID